MFKVKGFLGGKLVIDWRMPHIPRVGETMRFSGNRYAKCTEVIWCMDEESTTEIQRVNLRFETLKEEPQ